MAYTTETRGAKRKRIETTTHLSTENNSFTSTTVEDETNDETRSKLCGACDDKEASAHCVDCPMFLCKCCLQIHRKIKASAAHIVSEITTVSADSIQVSTVGELQETENVVDICQLHKAQKLNLICKTCIELLCESCNNDHNGHNVESIDDNIDLCQVLSRKYAQKLCDYYHDFATYKKLVEGTVKSHEESIKEVRAIEVSLKSTVGKFADCCVEDVKEKRDIFNGYLTEESSWLNTGMANIDYHMDILHSFRKTTDAALLLRQLLKSKELLLKVEIYKKLYVKDKLPSKAELLPERFMINDRDFLAEHIQRFFRMSETAEMVIDIESPYIGQSKKTGYQFCECDIDPTSLYLFKGTDVRKLNLETYEMERFESDVTIYSMAQLSQDEYVCAGITNEKEHSAVYILNKDFKKKLSYLQEAAPVSCVSRRSDNSFWCCDEPPCEVDDYPSGQFVKIIKIESGTFTVENEIDLWYVDKYIEQIKKHPVNGNVYFGAKRQFTIVNTETLDETICNHDSFEPNFCVTKSGKVLYQGPIYGDVAEAGKLYGDGIDREPLIRILFRICQAIDDLIVVGGKLYCVVHTINTDTEDDTVSPNTTFSIRVY